MRRLFTSVTGHIFWRNPIASECPWPDKQNAGAAGAARAAAPAQHADLWGVTYGDREARSWAQ